jgi:hypothetical protein
MGDHTLIGDGRPEPVLAAEAVKAVLVALVAFGWVVLDNLQIELVVTAVGAVAALVLTFVARSRVTPIEDPLILGVTDD